MLNIDLQVIMLDRKQAQEAKAVLDDFTSQLAMVRATVTDLERRIVDMTNTLAPVSSIPSEILATIFKELGASDGYLRYETRTPRSKLPSIMLASHVNRRFRHVAVGTPSLWTGVHIHLSSDMDIYLMEAYLERSQSCGLDIHVVNYTHTPEGIYQVFGRLVSHCGRWKTLSVESESSFCMRRIISGLQSLCVPQLESIQIALSGSIPDGTPISSTDSDVHIFRGGAPALASIELRNVSLLCCFPPLNALRTLDNQTFSRHTHLLSYDQFHHISMTTPFLTKLRLSNLLFSPDIGNELVPIDLLSLRTLTLVMQMDPSKEDGSPLIDVFKALRIPCLQTLEIKSATTAQTSSVLKFLQAEARLRYPALQSLALRDINCSNCITLDLIHALPNITSLSLIHAAEDIVLKILTEKEVFVSQMWPQLRTLEVAVVDLDLLREFISARESRIDSLTLARARGSPEIPPDCYEWLKAHVRFVNISAL